MIGLTTANTFHPGMIRVPCRGFKTPIEVFDSDDLFREAITKRIRFGDNLKPWGIRKALFSMRRTQRVSNFRPTAAKAIYEHFRPHLTVDFSAGWGGRMLGAMAAGVPYVGIDPNTEAVEGNRAMWSKVSRLMEHEFDVTYTIACAEDVLGKGCWSPDLIFTSPPYFDAERYSNEPTQSYLRHPTEERWFSDFLGVCIEGSFSDLTDGGHLVLNVNKDMEERVETLALAAGFTRVARWELLLSQHQYNKKSSGLYRTEPVLVFSKGQSRIERPPKAGSTLDLFGGGSDFPESV